MGDSYSNPGRMVFVGGAHIDQIMRLKQAPISGVSNPALMEISPGGASLNAASIASALGLQCAIVSPVGADVFGGELVSACRERGIEPLLVTLEGEATGLYSAIIEPGGDVVIAASDLSIYDRIDKQFLSRHLAPALYKDDGLFLTSNLSEAALAALAGQERFLAAVTISPAKAARLRGMLSSIDLLFTNLGEARVLSEMKGADSEQLCHWFISKGVKSGTISNGEHDLYCWYDGEIFIMAGRAIETIIDVNGAGDALAGGVLAGIRGGMDFHQAVEQGMKAARFTLGHHGPFDPDFSPGSLEANS